MPRHALLSDAQRHAIETAHFDLDRRDIVRHWTLSADEIFGIQRRRRGSNRFGFAVQLCLLRFPGWPPRKDNPAPAALLRYVGEQLGIEATGIEDYFRRQPTRSEHLREIIDLYGFRPFSPELRGELEVWLKSQAHRWNSALGMLMALLDQMRAQRIIIPALSTVEDLAWRTHRQVEQEAFEKIAGGLTPTQRAMIDTLLQPSTGGEDRTLTWLRRPLGSPGVQGMLDLLDRLEFVRSHETGPRLTRFVSPLLVRQFANRGARHTLQHLRGYEINKRLGITASYLLECQPMLLDEITGMFTRLAGRWFNRAEKRRWRSFQDHGRTINQKLHEFVRLGDALVAARNNKTDLEAAVEAALGWESLTSSVDETKRVAAPVDFSNLDELPSQYARVRQYAPRLLRDLSFEGIAARQPLLNAVEQLRQLNASHQRAVPGDAPRTFVPPRWRPHVFADGKIDRAYYELCVLNELNLALRSGDVWVVGSRQFLPLDGYLLPQTEWANRPLAPGQLTCEQYLEPRRPQLHDGLERILSLLADGKLPDIALEAGRLSITPLEAEAPPEAEGWSDRLYDLLPRVQITDLLSEVDSWTGFTGHFLHLYKQQPAADRATVLAVILSDATNLGLAKIAEAMPGRSDRHLSRVADWHVREENYAKALADLIHKQHEVPLAAHWGSGSTSSSDGQAFPIGTRKPVLADTNAKYGRDPVVMIYSHISDRYAPFYTKAIRSNARDAPYVLDGLLEHGAAGLRIDEHYTDTGGVTEQVFALCHLLGFRFAPRIRDLPDRRLYTFRPLKQYGILKELAADVADTELIERNSIRMGKVSASLVVDKLAAYPRGSEVARALRELGRIERTLYTLDWLQQPELRRRVQAGLNKGELRNSLARAIRFYRRGSVGDRDREEQQRKASGLNLVIGAISLWNSVYLDKAVAAMAKAGTPAPEHVLPHLSPLAWEHITLTGIYRWRRYTSNSGALRSLRPVRTAPGTPPSAQAG